MTTTVTTLGILVLEDEPRDADLVQRELRRDGLDFNARVFDTRDDLLRELEEGPPDLILSDFSMPSLTALEALELVRERAPSTPLIVVTGAVDEETAVRCMVAGAADYVLKDNLGRLGPTVRRVLRERALSEERDAALRQLRFLTSVVEQAPDGIVCVDLEGNITYMNAAAEELFGWTSGEALGLKPDSFNVDPQAEEIQRHIWDRCRAGKVAQGEALNRRKDGSTFVCQFRVAPLFNERGEIVAYMGSQRDVTEDRRNRDSLVSFTRELEARNRIIRAFLDESGEGLFSRVLEDVLGALRSTSGLFGFIDVAGDLVVPSMIPDVRVRCREPGERTVFPRDAWPEHVWASAILEPRLVQSNEGSTLVPDGHNPVHRYIAAPIVHRDSVVGLLHVANKASDYDEGDLELTRTIVALIAPILHERLAWQRAEAGRLDAEERLRLAVTAGSVGPWEWDTSTDQVRFSAEWKRQIGYEEGEIDDSFETWRSRLHPDDIEATMMRIQECFADPSAGYEAEFRLRHKDGSYRWIRAQGAMVGKGNGPENTVMMGVHLDITESRHAERALAERERYFRSLIYGLHEDLIVVGQDMVITDVNNSFLRTVGLSRDRAVGQTCHDVIGGGATCCYGDDVSCPVREAFSSGLPSTGRHVRRHTDGSDRHLELLCSPILDDSGAVTHVVEAVRDLTDLVEANNHLARSEELLHGTLNGMVDGLLIADPKTMRFVSANHAMAELLGYSLPELLGLGVADIHPEESLAEIGETFEAQLRGEYTMANDLPVKHRDGRVLWVDINATPITIEDRPLLLGVFRDATGRREQTALLEASERRFRAFFENEPEYCLMLTPDGVITDVNRAVVSTLGYSIEELVGQSVAVLYESASQDRAREVIGNNRLENQELVILAKGGRRRTVLLSAGTVTDEQGLPLSSVLVMRDITELRSAEEQLRQSQKLEAIGRLAGGVAHDFNNNLQAINMYCDLMHDALRSGDPLLESIEQIKGSAGRAAKLTHQLLAFGRQQALTPEVVDLGGIIGDMDSMLRRLLGETVVIRTEVAGDLGRVRVDPGQIEQVVVNLAVNARDAMSSGGCLTVSAANFELGVENAGFPSELVPGRYVTLAVADTGHGMDEEIQSRIFEPFFTTKMSGSGLGLATVFGIAKQSGGHISCSSEPGLGTTFTLYLARVDDEITTRKAPWGLSNKGGDETIIVAEDEAVLRQGMARILSAVGYRVLTAANGGEALIHCRNRKGPVHLLVTDLIMPGMTGKELASELEMVCPGIRVLYMSGYSEDALGQRDVLGEGATFLQKPFDSVTLKTAIRRILDGSGS